MSPRRALLAILSALGLSSAAAAQRVDLTEPLRRLGLTGEVTAFTLMPDGTRALVVLADTSGPVLASTTLAERSIGARLSPAGLAELDPPFVPSAGDGRVAFRARRSGESTHRLFVVPADGASTARELALPALEGDLADFQLDAHGLWAVLHYGRTNRELLYALPSDGSGAPVELNPPVGSDREVRHWALAECASGPRALYVLDELRNAWYELFSVPLDRSLEPVRLNGDLALHGDVSAFVIDPMAAHAAYLAEEHVTDQVELFTRPIDGSGTPLALAPPPVPGGDVRLARFTPDGHTLVFLEDLEEDERVELFAAPADAGAPAVKLSGALVAGGDVLDFACAGSRRVLYRADADTDGRVELYGVDLGSPGRAQRLSDPLLRGDVEVWEPLVPAGLALYTAARALAGARELFAAPLRAPDGAARATRPALVRALAPGLEPATDAAPAWVPTPDGIWLFLRARRATGAPLELFVLPTRGAPKPVRVDGSAAGDVQEVRLTSDGTRVVYRLVEDSGASGLVLRFLGRP